ncbi:hypothetical protein SLEP1_g23437 [Rubroshorea leprosula]|uniref:Uncharacterized protein n=1 Tax=Rubroshorea leprosula TaxID=152421 RepID=A0AAV5JMR6_9ROSI|nr:hypothetical protein SLEP1_g23437 [Rubroshorea leprosula]
MICFGTEKIRVALAIDRKPSHPNPKPPRILPPSPPPTTFKMRSFAEVFLNSPPPQKNSNENSPQPQPMGSTEDKRAEKVTLVLDEELEDCSWLQNCATGEVHTPDLIPGLQQVLWENGFSFIHITPMGGCKVLLSTDDMNLTTKFIEEEGAWWNKECLDAARILISTTEADAADQIEKGISLSIWNHLYPLKVTEERWQTDPWWLRAAKVYVSDASKSDDLSEADSGQISDSWGLSSNEEVKQPKQFKKDPLNELNARPATTESPKKLASSPPVDFHQVKNMSNDQIGLSNPSQAHPPINGSGLNPSADNSPAQVNLDENPQMNQECFQNSETQRSITGLHRGINKKSSKHGKRNCKQGKNSGLLSASLSDNFLEERSSLSAKEVDDMDIRRFVEFSKRLGLYFVGNEEAFASKFQELEERDLGLH